jgi:multiple sugar transport system ATP-binding protein
VAAFIGSPAMNLFEAALTEDRTTLVLGGQRIPLPDEATLGHAGLAAFAGKPVVVGMRPEHLAPARADEATVIESTVDLVEALGSELLVHFRIDARRVRAEGVSDASADELGESELAAHGEGVARFDPREQVKPGERLHLGVDVERLHFFDPVSGDAIRG